MVALFALLASLFGSGPSATAPADTAYVSAIHAERVEREARLRSDDGWLAVAGLYWLAPGVSTFGSDRANDVILPAGSAPARAGRFVLAGDSVRVEIEPGVEVMLGGGEGPGGKAPGGEGPGAEGPGGKVPGGERVSVMTLRSDDAGRPDVLVLADLRLSVIKRARGYAIRLRDLNAPARKDFHGLAYYPVDPSWRIEARYVLYDPPKRVPIPSVIGTVDTLSAPGYVEFEREGRSYRLDPASESAGEDLFLIFKDATSGDGTYPPGRFLYADPPVDGVVILDFNRAVNPPCAYTAFATCPLPPPQNALALAVTAGEKMVPGHE